MLLFAGGPTREYQFLRTLLYREVTEKRLEMSILLQTGRDDHVDQDVEAERLLRNFPHRLGAAEAGEEIHEPERLRRHRRHRSRLAGARRQPDQDAEGMGRRPCREASSSSPARSHTFQLARPADVDITALKTLLPVHLNDSRLHGLGGLGHDTTRPYMLNFTPAARLYDFLKLDESDESPIGGWDKFFWEAANARRVGQGRRSRSAAFLITTPSTSSKPTRRSSPRFAGPEASRINDGKDEQPFIVSMRYGNGKTMYIGSAETWRLRHAKDTFHERFWIKLCRYMSAGTTQQKKYGRILLARSVPVGNVAFEAQVKGQDLLPLPQ